MKDSTNDTKLRARLQEADLQITDLPLIKLDQTHHLDSQKLKHLGNTLDEIDRQIDSIAKHRKTKTIYETTMDGLKYTGYAALSIIAGYLIYKFRVLNLLKRIIQPMTRPCTQTFINCFHQSPRDTNYTVRYHPEEPVPTITSQVENPPSPQSNRPHRLLDFAITKNIAKS